MKKTIIHIRNNVIYYYIDNKPQMIIPSNDEKKRLMGEIIFVEEIDKLSHKNNLNILNIGLGAGYTTQEILKRNNVSNLDVIEIYQEVIDNLREFETYFDIVSDERTNIICADAYNYVETCDKKYDIVVMDICQPEIECSGKLFEEDFIKNVKKILKEDGIFLIWYYHVNNKRKDHANKVYFNLKNEFNFVDFIYNVNSNNNDTRYVVSDVMYEYNECSLLNELNI